MKKLGVNNAGENKGNSIQNKDGTNKKTIEVNKNMRRLTFLNNESNDSIEGNKNKYDKNKVKEINDVFKNCMVALSHNKICTRNAFDIHIIEHLEDLINLNDEEIPEELNDEMIENGEFNLSFTRASKAIEGATKVYGYRVEAIYDQTYNFLTNMNLAKQFELDNDMMDDNKNTIDPLNKRMRKRKLTYLQESSTLAKSSDITVDSLSLSNISVDTFFLKLNSTYDHSCGQKYLLPNLNLNNDLSIQFDGDIDVCEYKKRRKTLDDIGKDGVKDKEDGIHIIMKNKNDDNCDTYDKIICNNNDINKVDEKKNNDVDICENRNKKNESCNIYVDTFNVNEHKEFFDIYKKKLFLNADILKEILYGGPDDFNSLHICPELDYFKEELKKHKLKRTDSKDTDDVDKEDGDGNLYNDDDIGNTDKNNIINFYDENLGCNMSNNMLMESIYNSDALNTDRKNIFPENLGMSCGNLNEEKKNNNMNSSNNNLNNCNYDNNDLYLGDYRMDDLNIENVMQESLGFDNLNYSCDKNMNFSNNNGMLLQQSINMMDGMNFPELIKSENKELDLGNTQINNEHYLLKNNYDIHKRHSIISEVPDDDTLWNRSVMTFENRINAIDINNELNYHYYMPNKLMMMGNFRNLIDINKNVTNNINNNNKSTILQNIIMQKKMKYAFDVTSIDFENLYTENNNIELSTYDLWKKEKKKYVSNALFCIDQTSYIFDTRENCVNCVNTVTDKVMKFSKFCVYPDFLHACNKNRNKHNNNNNNINKNHMNVILNEVNNDNILNDIDPINQDDFNNNIDNFDMENMDDMNDGHLHEGLNEAIDKYYNMDFDNIWANNDNKNNDNINNNNNLNNSTYNNMNSHNNNNNNNNNNLSLFKKHSNFFNTALFQFNHSNTFGNVPFENVSKFVDVAKIKKILCDIVKPNEEQKSNTNDSLCEYQTEKDNQIVTYTAEKTTTFEEIVKETTAKLNESEASSTSIHMLFVCLLYTCNDQELLLEKIPNQNNFYVRYGLPVECHVNHDDIPMLKN
ncbi:hypothetical protein PFAG_04278 [Plasmodium falciparum Santa Lucia]|uniref:Condensin complex subunit 2 n=1 Tax=Plasmodium falciparum Santa Lucia TaxID=478859 RepID=W7FPU9_PLAFA|nr:hypothetical protein PFAG_04278 [Plasmodium falciparum Santa Lucia]